MHLHRHAHGAEEALVAAPVVADDARRGVPLGPALDVEHFEQGVVEAAEHLVPEGGGRVVHALLLGGQVDGLRVEGGRFERELAAMGRRGKI